MIRRATLTAALMAPLAAHIALAETASLIDGEVMKVDMSASKITIKHGPIKKLGMDQGMTMVFTAKDPDMLKPLKAGDKIKFDPDQVNAQFIVTRIVKSK